MENAGLIQRIVENTRRESFVEGYEAPEAEALGVAIAKYFAWSAEPLLAVAQAMFEDANMHALNRLIDEWEATLASEEER